MDGGGGDGAALAFFYGGAFANRVNPCSLVLWGRHRRGRKGSLFKVYLARDSHVARLGFWSDLVKS